MNRKLRTSILKHFIIYKRDAPLAAVAEFAAMPREKLSLCHFGLGLYLRNEYLRPESELHQLFIADGVSHIDDMSSAMIRIWHQELRKETQNSLL